MDFPTNSIKQNSFSKLMHLSHSKEEKTKIYFYFLQSPFSSSKKNDLFFSHPFARVQITFQRVGHDSYHEIEGHHRKKMINGEEGYYYWKCK